MVLISYLACDFFGVFERSGAEVIECRCNEANEQIGAFLFSGEQESSTAVPTLAPGTETLFVEVEFERTFFNDTTAYKDGLAQAITTAFSALVNAPVVNAKVIGVNLADADFQTVDTGIGSFQASFEFAEPQNRRRVAEELLQVFETFQTRIALGEARALFENTIYIVRSATSTSIAQPEENKLNAGLIIAILLLVLALLVIFLVWWCKSNTSPKNRRTSKVLDRSSAKEKSDFMMGHSETSTAALVTSWANKDTPVTEHEMEMIRRPKISKLEPVVETSLQEEAKRRPKTAPTVPMESSFDPRSQAALPPSPNKLPPIDNPPVPETTPVVEAVDPVVVEPVIERPPAMEPASEPEPEDTQESACICGQPAAFDCSRCGKSSKKSSTPNLYDRC